MTQGGQSLIQNGLVGVLSHALLEHLLRFAGVQRQPFFQQWQHTGQLIDDGDLALAGGAGKRVQIDADDSLAASEKGFAAVAVLKGHQHDVGPGDAVGVHLPARIVAAGQKDRSRARESSTWPAPKLCKCFTIFSARSGV